MVLRKVLLQALSSLACVTSWALVTRDGVDHSLSLPLWNRVLGVDKLLPKCPEWAEGNPDVQVAGVRKGNVLALVVAEHVFCTMRIGMVECDRQFCCCFQLYGSLSSLEWLLVDMT